MKNGWYKIVYDPHMNTDFWPPNDEISFVEAREDEFLIKKTWNEHKKVVEENKVIVSLSGSYLKWIKFIPIGFDVEENPKDQRIDDIFWKKDKFD